MVDFVRCALLSGVPGPEGGRRVCLQANSGRFNLSFFVEKPSSAGRTNQDCYRFYWPQGQRNPQIAKDTIVVSESPKFVRVQYDIVATFQGKPIRDRNVNYYFAYREKWIDVHISIVAPEPSDVAVFAAFDSSLRYGLDGAGERLAQRMLSGEAPTVPLSKVMELMLKGSVLFLKGDYSNAIPPYQMALQLEKEGPTLEKTMWRVLVNNLGMACRVTGDLKRSKETLEYGLSKDPQNAMFHYLLACTLAELNDLEATIASLRKAYEYKGNQIEGEQVPDPRQDSSFQRFLHNERFLAALREMEKAP